MTQKALVVKIPDWGQMGMCYLQLVKNIPSTKSIQFPKKDISQNMTQKAPVAETPDWGRWRCVI